MKTVQFAFPQAMLLPAALTPFAFSQIPATPNETAFRDPRYSPYAACNFPTVRWTAYDAKQLLTNPLPDTRVTVTERAYTSPIWDTPGA
jgi:hypothetical protein